MQLRKLVIGLLAILGCVKVEGKIFHTIYQYSGNVRVGSSSSQHDPQFRIDATLTAVTEDNKGNRHALVGGVSTVMFRLSDVSYQVSQSLIPQECYKGKVGAKYDQKKSLERPFQVIYKNGKVKSILTKKESEWSMNIKKSVAAIFQLDLQKLHIDKLYNFSTSEETTYGKCRINYDVQPKDDGYVDIQKTQEYSKCENIPHRYFTNYIYDNRLIDFSDDSLIKGSKTYYNIYIRKPNNTLEIKNITSESLTSAGPLLNTTDDQTILVRQNINFLSSRIVHKRLDFKLHPKKLTLVEEVKFLIPDNYTKLLIPPNNNNLTSFLEKENRSWEDISNFISNATKKNEKLHNQKSELLFYLGKLNQDKLISLFDNYVNSTTNEEENMSDVFLQLVAQVGTKDSILSIRSIISEKKIPEILARKLLQLVPFYIRNPSIDLLEEYKTLLNANLSEKLNKTAVLSISNFVFMSYKKIQDIKIIKDYADIFYKSFNDATDYEYKLNYLSALSNLEESIVYNYLAEIVKNKTYPNNLRYIALWGTKTEATIYHTKGYKLYWPIFTNRDENIEMRAAAMKLFITTNPTYERFAKVFWFMLEEANSQLYYFFYTGMESLNKTKHPCYQNIKQHTGRLLRYTKVPDTYNFTRDFLMEETDTIHSIGGHSIISLIGDSIVDSPNIIYFSQGRYCDGHNQNYFGVLMRNSHMQQQNRSSQDISKDMKKVPLVPQNQSYGHEIIFYTGNQITEIHFGYGNISSIVGEAEVMSTSDKFLSLNNLVYDGICMEHDLVQPTEIGLPLVRKISVPHSLSLSTTNSLKSNRALADLQNDREIRYGHCNDHSLKFFNPISETWK